MDSEFDDFASKMNNRRRTKARRGQMNINPSLDYISSLPDETLENILGRLSIRGAVGTTILSEGWKNK